MSVGRRKIRQSLTIVLKQVFRERNFREPGLLFHPVLSSLLRSSTSTFDYPTNIPALLCHPDPKYIACRSPSHHPSFRTLLPFPYCSNPALLHSYLIIHVQQIWEGIFGLIAGIASFRSGWKATALPSLPTSPPAVASSNSASAMPSPSAEPEAPVLVIRD